ncbi:SpoIIE family protein phosphatase [Jannaschia sp. R86511]|uniref:SpoIIE family protein phosphatase n=1 Tax=Jannaschia sp. R86511 TaxID=3093853 RepID=UPI0036D30226
MERGAAVGTENRAEPPGRSPAAVHDPARLDAVRATGLLDALDVGSLDHLTDLAATLLGAPLAFLTVVDDERSYWASCAGVTDGTRQNTVEESFCQYVIADSAPFVVADASTHPRTRDNPSVRSMGVRAWAGYPVMSADGHALGSFCVVDTVPREWEQAQLDTLRVLAEAASAHVTVMTHTLAAEREQTRRDVVAAAEHGLARMAGVALLLGSVDSAGALARIVLHQGLPALGASGGLMLVRADTDGQVRVVDETGTVVGTGSLSDEDRLPGLHTARTGEAVLLSRGQAHDAFAPAMAELYRRTGEGAWAFTPMRVGQRVVGAVGAAVTGVDHFPASGLTVLDGFSALCAQTLDRLQRQEEQRSTNRALAHMSETLQRSLLTQPADPPGLTIAVRYEPASHAAQVGGDWYDAFVTADGRTTLAIGDISGHDSMAAAAMGQVRSLVRGLSFSTDHGPARLLTSLDVTLRALALDTLATAALAHVEAGPGGRRLRWSSAGHLPPLLREADGTVRVLDGTADLMLGVDPATDRRDLTVDLPTGSTLLLYTDGLVESRGVSLQVGIDRLRDQLADVGGQHPEQVCDALLGEQRPDGRRDDTALLVVRFD